MIHISQEELLKKIEQEHNQLFEEGGENLNKYSSGQIEDMSSILPTTCVSLRDRNNNSISSSTTNRDDEDEIQAVLITGNTQV